MKPGRSWKRRRASAYRGRQSKAEQIPAVLGCGAFVLGLVCLVLPGVRFSGLLFLGIAAGCLLWMFLRKWAKISWIGNGCKRIFLVGLALLFAVLLTLEGFVLKESAGEKTEQPTVAVIVLGAGVNGETPSLSLQTRIDAAAAYLEKHPGIPAVLTGGKGSGEQISEAEAMRRGLQEQGVAGERLLLEEKASNTAENFEYSVAVLQEHGVDTAAPIAVVSNDFHLFRAKILASRSGLGRTVGVPARLPWWWLSANYYVREAFASVKTLLFD